MLGILIALRLLTHLNLQEIIPSNSLIVHLVVGIVGIASTLVFNEGKAEDISTRELSETVKPLTADWKPSEELGYHSAQAVRTWTMQSVSMKLKVISWGHSD